MEKLKTQRICILHFKLEDFDLNVLGIKRTARKETAYLPIFTFNPVPDDEQPGPSKRIRLEVRLL